MKNYVRFFVSIALIFGFLFNGLPAANACGPFTVDPLFAFTKHGGYPLESFAGGRVGVVPNSYGRISLFVFYRQLNNAPLTASEQKQAVEAMRQRIGLRVSDVEAVQNGDSSANQSPSEPDFYTNWTNARAKISADKSAIATEKKAPNDYSFYENCLGDSFNTAAETLESRIAKYGAGENTKEWLNGQDAVFSNCGGEGRIPESVGANFPEWLLKDRQYQIAAALFYSAKLPEARNNFANIAADKNSDWNKTSTLR